MPERRKGQIGRKNENVSTPSAAGRRPTIHDVAAAAGVSTGTVSRVAGGHARVAPETRAQVLQAMASIGYQPNAAARAMRTNRSKSIGFLMPDIGNQVVAKVASGAESVLGPAGYMLFTFASHWNQAQEAELIDAVMQRQIDGLMVSLCDETATATSRRLEQLGIPLVILDRDVAMEADFVFSEHVEPMEIVVRHMASMGHRRIGMVTTSENIRPGRERVRGYLSALEREGLEPDPWLVRTGIQSVAFGAAETHDLLTGANPPTGIIAAGSDIFPGALKAVRMLGLDIPGEISFVGSDDLLLSEISGPPITVIDRDMMEVGRQAARILLDRLAGGLGPHKRVLLPSTVVLRHSVAPPRTR